MGIGPAGSSAGFRMDKSNGQHLWLDLAGWKNPGKKIVLLLALQFVRIFYQSYLTASGNQLYFLPHLF